MNDLYYEDFEVGQSFTSRTLDVTGERLVAFAEEFDPQPQHVSEQAAGISGFGGLIGSGWHTVALSMRLQHEAALGRIAGGSAEAAVENLTWPRPVRPGDTLHVVVEVKQRLTSSSSERGIIRFLTTTLNQHGQTVQTMLGAVLVPRMTVT